MCFECQAGFCTKTSAAAHEDIIEENEVEMQRIQLMGLKSSA